MADRWRIAVQAAGHFEEAAQTCVASEPPVWGWGKGLHLGQTGELSALGFGFFLPPAAILFAAARKSPRGTLN
jgi:hypothetical protein